MSLSKLPLSYCTNVHPGRSLAELEAGLDRYTVNIHRQLNAPLAAGLWLAESVVQELLSNPDAPRKLADGLAARDLTCHTLNAFPYGDFHAVRVKEQVYLPDWSNSKRRKYTEDCAAILATLLPPGTDGSISTLPLGFKGFNHPQDFLNRCCDELIACAKTFAQILSETGKMIRLAIEPEPLCILETTNEAIEFFKLLWQKADAAGELQSVKSHVGLCYDVCHQAVEFEDVAASIRLLAQENIRINKVHVSCAIHLDNPMENAAGRDALRRYIEPRYLHQTIAWVSHGTVAQIIDLNEALLNNPYPQFAASPAWRVHFHVPVDADQLGPLLTTRPALIEALTAIAALDYSPHLEVETYTWEVLPDSTQSDLVEGLTRELRSTAQLLAAISPQA